MAGPGQEIAHGRIVVELDDRATRDLDRIDREFHRTMADIERERASVKIDIDSERLKDDLKAAEKAVKDYEKTVESEENKRAKAQRQRHLETLRQRAAQKRAALDAAAGEARAQTLATKAARLAQKEIDAIAKAEERRARVFDQTHKRHMQQMQAEARRRGQLFSQREREFRADERMAHQMEAARARELAQIPKMQRAYASLESQLVKLAASRRKARGDRQALTVIDLREREVIGDMERLRARLVSIGEQPISIHAELDRGTRSGAFIRDAFKGGGIRGAASAAGIAAGVSIGSGITRGIDRTFSRGIVTDAINAGFRGLSRVGGLLEGLSNVTVRIGPFTATIRQLALAMSLFAPLIVDVVGALGSMVSVVGAATLGVGALSVGLVGGALPALIGVTTVLKPMITQFKDVTALSKAYNKAVLQYGKGSDQAAKALQKMNHALGSVDDQTRRAFRNAGTLADRWEKLTDPSRASAFHIMGRGLDFLNGGLEQFAANTNETFSQVEQATDRWFDGLESAEGRHILDTMWDNFNAALGPALDGLGNVATYLGRVGAVASEFLPGLARSFRLWSQGLADSAANTDNLRERIHGVVDAARSLGQFLVAGGRFLRTFFAGGVAPGVSLIDTMTNALNRWNMALQTTQGQHDLGQFFSRAVSGAQALYRFLAPLVETFTQWATMLSPVSAGIFNFVGAIAGAVGALTRLTFLQGPLNALGATLAAMWAIGRIGAATTAISNFATALFGLGRASSAAAVGQTALGAANARVAGTSAALAATGAAAARSGTQVGVLRGIAQTAIPAIAGMGAVAGGIATAGLTVLAGAAAYGVYKLATAKSEAEKLREELDNLGEGSKNAAAANAVAESQLDDFGSAANRAQLNLKMARDRLRETKKGTDEYKLALLDYRDAQRYASDAQAQANQNIQNYIKSGADRNKIDSRRAELSKKITEAQRKLNEATKDLGEDKGAGRLVEKTSEELAKLRAEYAKLTDASERAANAQAAQALNIKRGWMDLAPVIGAAKQQLGALARSAPKVAAKIAVKFDAPKDVGRVAAQASRALRAGAPARIVTKIVADSKNADQAIARINKVTFALKRVPILQEGGQRAIAILEKIKGTKLTRKEQQIAERGGPQVVQLLGKILGFKIPPKTVTIQANDLASSAIRSVSSMLAALDGKTANTYVNTYHRNYGGARTKAAGGYFAAGGSTGSTPDQNRIERAAAEASRREARSIKGGGTVNRPTYLTGEENRKEIIISTNPAYRRQNLAYLRTAARALGSNVISAATGFEPNAGKLDTGGVNIGGTGFYAPSAMVGKQYRPEGGAARGTKRLRGIGKKKKKTKMRNIYSRNDNWTRYIGGLHTLQDDWDREVSIREQAVVEPESFLKEVSRTPGEVLPDGTKTPDIVKYEVDTGIVNSFTAQLQSVKDAYDKLITITVELMSALPRAINAAQNEWSVRGGNIERLLDARKKHAGLAKNAKDPDTKAQHKKKVAQIDKQLAHEKDERKKLGGNMKQYREDRKEAGFDQREYRLSSEQYGRQIGAVAGTAAQDAIRENDQGGGGSGGGGTGGAATPMGVQIGNLNAAQMDVLKEFAGNFAAIGATPGGLGGGVAGNLANLGRNPVVAGAAIGGAIASGAGFGGGAGASSIMSAGSAAGAAVAQPSAIGGGVAPAGGVAPVGAGDKNVVVNNYFQEQPADPHTWSSNTAFELGALI